MRKYARITDHEELIKDVKTGAVLLSNHATANEYNMKRKSLEDARRMASEINTIKERLGSLETVKDDLADIKSLLKQIAGNGTQ